MPLIEQPLAATYNGRAEAVLVRGMRVERHPHATRRSGGKVVDGQRSPRITAGQRPDRDRQRGWPSRSARRSAREISLFSPQGQTTPFGTVPRIVSYTVGAIFEIGVYDYDKAYVVMPIEDAQTLLLMGDAVGHGRGRRPSIADRVGEILAPARRQGRRRAR